MADRQPGLLRRTRACMERAGNALAAARNTQPTVFISYRRADSAAIVGHLYERLVAHYTKDCVFRDIDDIPLARNFHDAVRAELSGCDVVLVVIGPRWLAHDSSGQSRLLKPDDPVRIELEAAFESGAAVIPVMVEGAAIPEGKDLPASAACLPSLNGAHIDSGRDFDHHLKDLIGALDRILERRRKFVVRFPAWALPAALGCALVSALGVAALNALPLVTTALTVNIWEVAGVASLLALACGLFGGAAAASRRVPVIACQKRPTVFAVSLGVFALLFALEAASLETPYLHSNDPVYLAHSLRKVFAQERDDAERGHTDFAGARKLVATLHQIDEGSGHAWYYAGEISRASAGGLFHRGCFTGWLDNKPEHKGNLTLYQQEFYRYRDIKPTLAPSETEGPSSADICYDRPRGYCVQRTAWIAHLLANDFYREAQEMTGGERTAALLRAQEFSNEARRYPRPEGGLGFDQCTPNLYSKIDAEVAGATTASVPAKVSRRERGTVDVSAPGSQ